MKTKTKSDRELTQLSTDLKRLLREVKQEGRKAPKRERAVIAQAVAHTQAIVRHFDALIKLVKTGK